MDNPPVDKRNLLLIHYLYHSVPSLLRSVSMQCTSILEAQ